MPYFDFVAAGASVFHKHIFTVTCQKYSWNSSTLRYEYKFAMLRIQNAHSVVNIWQIQLKFDMWSSLCCALEHVNLCIRTCKLTYLNVITVSIWHANFGVGDLNWGLIPKNMCICIHRKENGIGKSYMNVYGILKKTNSHVSKRNTSRMDAEATKLYSVMRWHAGLGTSWEL